MPGVIVTDTTSPFKREVTFRVLHSQDKRGPLAPPGQMLRESTLPFLLTGSLEIQKKIIIRNNNDNGNN